MFTQSDYEEIRKNILSRADEKLASFNKKLIKTDYPVYGVPLAELKAAAKAPSASLKDFVRCFSPDSYEEVMIFGFALGRAGFDECLEFLPRYISLIDNWSLCDSPVMALKKFARNRERALEFIDGYFRKSGEYELRFAFIALLAHFITEEYLDYIFKKLDSVNSEFYYVNMAKAWLLQTVYVKFPCEAEKYIRNNRLDDWTFNKALQKICESRRVDENTKNYMRTIKRK